MTTYIESFQGNVGVGTNDPGSYKLLINDGTSKFTAIEATSLTVNGITNSFIASGIIAMWSGSGASIPSGWVLCDGQNDTPDLRDRFIIGAGNTYNPGQTGGSHTKTLVTGNLPAHSHTGTVDATNVHNHTASANSQAAHTHGVNTASSGNHNHSLQISGTWKQHNHPVSTQASGWHSHSTYIPSAGGGQWGNLAGGYRNAFTGINGYKGSWGPSYGTNATGNHNHGFNLGQGGSHNHGIQVQQSTNHTHQASSVATSDHTHTNTSTGQSGNHTHNFTTQSTGQGLTFSIVPPYYALAYIMKQ